MRVTKQEASQALQEIKDRMHYLATHHTEGIGAWVPSIAYKVISDFISQSEVKK